MASVGIRNRGLFTLTSLCTKEPLLPLNMTLPATLRSLSNQVCHKPPPYVCTLIIRYPDLDDADLGFNFRHGLSVCAAITWKPLPTVYLKN